MHNENPEILITFDNFHNPENTLNILKGVGAKYIKSLPDKNAAVISVYFTKVSGLRAIQGVEAISFYSEDAPQAPQMPVIAPEPITEPILPVDVSFTENSPI